MSYVACVFALLAVSFAAPSPPVWPKQYTADALFSLPYGYGITEPIYTAVDLINNKAFVSYYNGMDTYYYRLDKNLTYMVIPRIDDLVCFGNPPADNTLPSLLPDLSDYTWVEDSGNVRTWQKNVTNLGLLSSYTMKVRTTDNKPIQLRMEGYDFLFGSHPDIYILDFIFFAPTVNNIDFEVPNLCNVSQPNLRAAARSRALLNLLDSTVNAKESTHPFDQFLTSHKKTYSPEEYTTRLASWKANMKMIEQHNNKEEATYTLKPNHFTDMDHEEFKYFMLPKSTWTDERPTLAEATFVLEEPTAEELAALPAHLDWRSHGAVTMVKDQGVCGSCWTFGTAGSIEGAWAVKYGKLLSVSEQQIVDCAWTAGSPATANSGCDGGFAGPAMQWVVDNKGIALEQDYPYLMVDGWCDASVVSSGITLKGYGSVVSGSEAALQAAVATYGPVAIAIDAAHEHFEYYSEGVYYNPNCKNGIDDLDHEVLVVGYGTDPKGGDYWIVKNSWSTHWGDNGFVKMARNQGNNCGIATQANFPLV